MVRGRDAPASPYRFRVRWEDGLHHGSGMKILLDNCTPAPLRKFLLGHEVKTAFEMGWADLMNGALLAAAEAEFELMITCDQNLRYQQNLSHRKIRLLVLTIGRWPILQQRAAEIATIVEGLAEAGYAEFPS